MDTSIGDMPLDEYVAEMVSLWYDTPPCPLVAVRARRDLVARIVVLVQAEVNAAIAIERERCARVCDDLRIEGQTQSAWVSAWADSGSIQAAEELARRIRALSHDSLAASASDSSPGGT